MDRTCNGPRKNKAKWQLSVVSSRWSVGRNKANVKRSFKFEVASVKLEKPPVGTPRLPALPS